MILYKIKNWNDYYENHNSRRIKQLTAVLVPIKHDGLSYRTIISRKDGHEILGSWLLLLQVAGKCPNRGLLTKNCGKPLTIDEISLRTGGNVESFKKSIEVLIDLGWIESEVIEGKEDEEHAHLVHTTCTPRAHPAARRTVLYSTLNSSLINKNSTCTEDSTKESPPFPKTKDQAIEALKYLNDKAGKHFEEVESHLNPIRCRLKEVKSDLEGVKVMIDRQVACWKDDSKMSEYLRPKTLFSKENFHNYYGNRNQKPIGKNERNNNPKSHTQYSTNTRAQQMSPTNYDKFPIYGPNGPISREANRELV